MTDPYTLLPTPVDPALTPEVSASVYAPARAATFTARMLQRLSASPLRLYSWGRGNLPRRLIDVVAAELELHAKSIADVLTLGIREGAYRAFEDADFFPPRRNRTLARGVVRLRSAFPLAVADVIPAGSLFGSADGRTVRAERDTTFPAGAQTLSVNVVSEVPGAGGNFYPGEITAQLSGRINYPTSNPSAIGGGRDEESDAERHVRFQDFIESRATASRLSLYSAAMNASAPDPQDDSAVLRCDDAALLLPWTVPGDAGEMGQGLLVIDGGGGEVDAALQRAVAIQVERVQAAGDRFVTVAVSPWVVALSLQVSVQRAADIAAVKAALTVAWNSLAASVYIEDGRGRGRLALFDVQRVLDAAHPDILTVKIVNHAADLQPPRGARLIAGVLSADVVPGGVL